MKNFYKFLMLVLILTAGCSQHNNEEHENDTLPINSSQVQPTAEKNIYEGSPVIAERINGPANIRDKANGKIIFTLNDSTLVTATEARDGWHNIGITAESNIKDVNYDTLKAGAKIIVEGKVVGEVMTDIYAPKSSDGKLAWAELTGYTHKDNIYAYSVIENALTEYIRTLRDRNIDGFRPFIKSFAMEDYDELNPYLMYFNYENWIDDPSPMPRVILVFHEKKLIGVAHSRDLELPDTVKDTLERGFKVMFYKDIPEAVRSDFKKKFNNFITQVD